MKRGLLRFRQAPQANIDFKPATDDLVQTPIDKDKEGISWILDQSDLDSLLINEADRVLAKLAEEGKENSTEYENMVSVKEQLENQIATGSFDKTLFKEFVRWGLGLNGTEKDKKNFYNDNWLLKKSSMETNIFAHSPHCMDLIRLLQNLMTRFKVQKEILKLEGPLGNTSTNGLTQAFLYWKYIVEGSKNKDKEFMRDYEFLTPGPMGRGEIKINRETEDGIINLEADENFLNEGGRIKEGYSRFGHVWPPRSGIKKFDGDLGQIVNEIANTIATKGINVNLSTQIKKIDGLLKNVDDKIKEIKSTPVIIPPQVPLVPPQIKKYETQTQTYDTEVQKATIPTQTTASQEIISPPHTIVTPPTTTTVHERVHDISPQIEQFNQLIKSVDDKIKELKKQETNVKPQATDISPQIAQFNELLIKIDNKIKNIQNPTVTIAPPSIDLTSQVTQIDNLITTIDNKIKDIQKPTVTVTPPSTDLTSQVTQINNLLKTTEEKIKEIKDTQGVISTEPIQTSLPQSQLDQLSEFKSTVTEIKTAVESFKKTESVKINELQTEVETYRKQVNDFESKTTNFNNEILKLNKNVNEREITIQNLINEKTNIKNELTETKDKLITNKNEIQILKTTIEDKQREIVKLEKTKNLSEEKEKIKQNEITNYKKEITELKKNVNELTVEKNTLKNTSDKLQLQLNEANNKISIANASSELLKIQLDNKDNTLNKITEKIDPLITSVDNLKTTITEAKGNINNPSDAIKIDITGTVAEQLTTKLENAVKTLDESVKKIPSSGLIEGKIDELKNEMTGFKDTLNQTSIDISNISGTMTNITSGMTEIESSVSELGTKIESGVSTYETKVSEIKNLINETSVSTEQIQTSIDGAINTKFSEIGEELKTIVPKSSDLLTKMDESKNKIVELVSNSITSNQETIKEIIKNYYNSVNNVKSEISKTFATESKAIGNIKSNINNLINENKIKENTILKEIKTLQGKKVDNVDEIVKKMEEQYKTSFEDIKNSIVGGPSGKINLTVDDLKHISNGVKIALEGDFKADIKKSLSDTTKEIKNLNIVNAINTVSGKIDQLNGTTGIKQELLRISKELFSMHNEAINKNVNTKIEKINNEFNNSLNTFNLALSGKSETIRNKEIELNQGALDTLNKILENHNTIKSIIENLKNDVSSNKEEADPVQSSKIDNLIDKVNEIQSSVYNIHTLPFSEESISSKKGLYMTTNYPQEDILCEAIGLPSEGSKNQLNTLEKNLAKAYTDPYYLTNAKNDFKEINIINIIGLMYGHRINTEESVLFTNAMGILLLQKISKVFKNKNKTYIKLRNPYKGSIDLKNFTKLPIEDPTTKYYIEKIDINNRIILTWVMAVDKTGWRILYPQNHDKESDYIFFYANTYTGAFITALQKNIHPNFYNLIEEIDFSKGGQKLLDEMIKLICQAVLQIVSDQLKYVPLTSQDFYAHFHDDIKNILLQHFHGIEPLLEEYTPDDSDMVSQEKELEGMTDEEKQEIIEADQEFDTEFSLENKQLIDEFEKLKEQEYADKVKLMEDAKNDIVIPVYPTFEQIRNSLDSRGANISYLQFAEFKKIDGINILTLPKPKGKIKTEFGREDYDKTGNMDEIVYMFVRYMERKYYTKRDISNFDIGEFTNWYNKNVNNTILFSLYDSIPKEILEKNSYLIDTACSTFYGNTLKEVSKVMNGVGYIGLFRSLTVEEKAKIDQELNFLESGLNGDTSALTIINNTNETLDIISKTLHMDYPKDIIDNVIQKIKEGSEMANVAERTEQDNETFKKKSLEVADKINNPLNINRRTVSGITMFTPFFINNIIKLRGTVDLLKAEDKLAIDFLTHFDSVVKARYSPGESALVSYIDWTKRYKTIIPNNRALLTACLNKLYSKIQ